MRQDRRAGERAPVAALGGGLTLPVARHATYLKARDGGRIISYAVILAVAVNEDGKREVLGVATGPSEGALAGDEGLAQTRTRTVQKATRPPAWNVARRLILSDKPSRRCEGKCLCIRHCLRSYCRTFRS